jgi:hypothetical protein
MIIPSKYGGGTIGSARCVCIPESGEVRPAHGWKAAVASPLCQDRQWEGGREAGHAGEGHHGGALLVLTRLHGRPR